MGLLAFTKRNILWCRVAVNYGCSDGMVERLEHPNVNTFTFYGRPSSALADFYALPTV